MSKFQPPPTYALPILVDEVTKKAIFNPIWLKWFIELSANLNSGGAGSGNVSGPATSVAGHFATWGNTSGDSLDDGGVVGSAAHAATTDFQAVNAKLTAIAALANALGWLHNDGAGVFAYSTPTAADVGALAVGGTAANSSQLLGKTWAAPDALGSGTPAAVSGTTVKATTAAGFISSDGSTGFTGTVTTASLVGKTITIKDGIITGFA